MTLVHHAINSSSSMLVPLPIKTFQYQVYQFLVESEFIPSFISKTTTLPSNLTKLTVRRTSLQSASLARRFRVSPYCDLGHGLLIEVGHTLIYLSFTSNLAYLDVSDENLMFATSRLLGLGIAGFTFFADGLSLFASGTIIDNHLVGLLGSSGTGKSTVLWSLLENGARFSNDDLMPILFNKGAHTAQPSVSLYPKLRPNTLKHFGVDTKNLIKMPLVEDKYIVPLPPDQVTAIPKPLSALFLLHPSSAKNDGITVNRSAHEEAVQIIMEHLHSKWLADKYIKPEHLLAKCEQIVSAVPVYTISYFKCFEVLPRLSEAIRAVLHSPVTKKLFSERSVS